MISATDNDSQTYKHLYDPISGKLMTDAVTLYPCGHTFSQKTIMERPSERCPLDGELYFSFSPDKKIRDLAKEMEAMTHSLSNLMSSPISEVLSKEDAKVLFFEVASKGLADQLELCLDSGMDVNVINDFGWTALLFTACCGHLLAVEVLLARKANPNAADSFNATALMWAARNGHPEILTALLDAGAEIDAIDSEGRTALMLGARAGKVEAVRVLLDRGANFNLETNYGTKAIDLARGKNHDEIVKLLEEKVNK